MISRRMSYAFCMLAFCSNALLASSSKASSGTSVQLRLLENTDKKSEQIKSVINVDVPKDILIGSARAGGITYSIPLVIAIDRNNHDTDGSAHENRNYSPKQEVLVVLENRASHFPAVSTLPSADLLYYKFIHDENLLSAKFNPNIKVLEDNLGPATNMQVVRFDKGQYVVIKKISFLSSNDPAEPESLVECSRQSGDQMFSCSLRFTSSSDKRLHITISGLQTDIIDYINYVKHEIDALSSSFLVR